MLVADFDYDLPEARIAQAPASPRDAARLLVDRGAGTDPVDRGVRDLPDLLEPGDVLVLNETRVRPARIRARKETGGRVEVLVLEPRADDEWVALVRPGRRLPPGTVVVDDTGRPVVEVGEEVPGEDHASGRRLVRLLLPLAEIGTVPFPPYVHATDIPAERYQTVVARTEGSAAAPTAGLHFTEELLERCRSAGAAVATVRLDIGLDTFRPVMVERTEDHVMHREDYEVDATTWATIGDARRVVAVGTTVVRTLEAAAATGARSGRTDLFIRRGHRFEVVDRLVTNFHQPRSSLLMMIDAFVGPRWRDLYDAALRREYRFLSFGDAMWLEPTAERVR